ncbi:uncharacterized protein N7443_008343 [Penicillium atrosanguineum]|uniref:uncharacterized protein n=1 Tax=Penicillium atrosanguineum TaxID=1132637 RepID=UPI0023963010|nr:uncharacterized protein N7443_008343 [Penicillium atrosanguineum]KAJ5292390.1 hypothetical protein N7443_008343 [Penicillium atrosanguineum]
MMEAPSSDFNFSFSSQSEVVLTPSSSSRGSHEGGSALNPQTPRSIPLFQALSLNDSPGSMLSPQARSSNTLLSPGSSNATYAQQHNASPSPSPRPAPVPSSHGGRQAERSRSIFFTPTRATPRIPGAFPESSVGEEACPSGRNAAENEEDSDSDEMPDARTGDLREEELPPAPVYKSRLQDGLKDVKRELGILAEMMGISRLSEEHSSDLHALCRDTKKMSMFKYPETRTVGFIGDSGVGKSSLINSLLDQRSLSRSSSGGTACTCVVTEFRHVDEDHTGPFTVEAQFMTSEEMKELLNELLTMFRQFNVNRFFRDLQSQEEQQKCRDEAVRAWETFESLFNSQPALTMEHLSEDYDGAHSAILAQLERWASAGLAWRPGGLDALGYSAIAGDIEDCRVILDMLTASNIDNGKPAIWPFIKLIRVYLKSPILKNGLVLADLPGFSDLNFARVRATERYLSHSCDEVFVVADIARACTNASVQDILRRCKPDQPKRIICTKSEDISPEESARGDNSHALRVKEMNKEIQAVRKKAESTESKARKVSSTRRSELADQSLMLRDKEKELNLNLTKFLITQRNSLISQILIKRHRDVQVFCVSNTLYSEYRFSGKSEEEAYVDLAGIRELRRYCHLVPAEALMHSAFVFLNIHVPTQLASLRQWTLSGTDSVTGGNAARLREVLENAQNGLNQELISNQGLAHQARVGLASLFEEHITNMIRQYQTRWTAASIEISQEWTVMAWPTYAAFCRNFGDHATKAVPKGRCWNDELLQPARDQLILNWDTLRNWLHMQEGNMARDARTIFDRWSGEIGEDDADLRVQISVHIPWKQCANSFIRNTMRDMAHGHASSYISGLMQPAYTQMNLEGGTGSDKRRKKIMNDHLTHSMLFAKFSNVAGREYTGALNECFDDLQRKVTEEVESMARDFNVVIAAEGQRSEAEEAPAVVDALRSRFEGTEAILERAQVIVQELNRETTHDVV